MDGGQVSEEVILVVDEGEPEIFAAWAGRIGLDTDFLENSGCGCCVDIYTVRASAAQFAELRAMLDAAQP